MKNWILIFVMSLSGSTLWGQASDFTVDVSGGCAPLTITVTDNSGAAPGNVLYDYGDGSARTTNTTHTYQTAGDYTITQFVGSGSGGNASTLDNPIVVQDGGAVDFTVSGCPSQGVLLELTDQNYDSYIVDFGDGTTTTLNSGNRACLIRGIIM
ncbi:MAG: PKD domain-containing protein, partial [Bacteroidota bacterium]